MANIDLGLQSVDPGLVPNGAKCAADKVPSPAPRYNFTVLKTNGSFRCASISAASPFLRY